MPRLTSTALGPWVRIAFVAVSCLALSRAARAQDQPPPAYLAVVEGVATLERDGESEPAVRDMPFLEGDRLRTENGRVEIQFPDGTAIEVAEYSVVEAVTATRVRLLAGTMDHIQRPAAAEAPQPMSASYLPQDLQPYGSTFDQYGSWQYAAPYGYVWYPTVTPGWRPYYYGRWSAVPSHGWSWLGIDAWSYPTHHYGRWGYARNAWFWIPGRTWGAAWVSWGAAPDYVSWCPLGFDNRPVFALSVTSYDSWRRGGGSWFGWTVMSRSHFGGRGYYAHRDAVEPRSLPAETPFIFSSRPPIGLPHQSAVASRRSPAASRQSAVTSRQSPAASRQSSVGGRPPSAESREFAAPRRQPAAGGREPSAASASAILTQPGADSRMASPRGDYGVPRRAYPIEAPRTVETPRFNGGQGGPLDRAEGPRAAAPEQPRVYPQAVPRYAPAPAPVSPIVAPTYRSPGQRMPDAQPQRWGQSPGAVPRGFGAPVQRAPAPSAAGAPAQAPAAAPAPPPSRSESGARSAPAGAAREGTAQPRSGGQGAPAGGHRRR
jgi:uncharacterized protein DUF6600